MVIKSLQIGNITIMYIKCPECAESTHISEWRILACVNGPVVKKYVPVFMDSQLDEDSIMICPKCKKNHGFKELIEAQ
jgi:hypothetical protein